MSLYLMMPLIEVAFCIALLVMLFIQGQQHAARKSFAVFLIFMAFWGFFIFLMRSSSSLAMAAFWENFVFFSILNASMAFYWFTISNTGTKITKKVGIPLLIFYLATVALIPTGLIFEGMQSLWYGKAPIIGPFSRFLFLLYMLPLL